MKMKAQTFLHFLRLAALSLCALASVCARAGDAAPAAPDRRELWVPFDKLGHVLDANAVLLTREQYDTLLRDAERQKYRKIEAPAAVVVSGAQFHAVTEGKVAHIHAELIVNVLRDGWCEVPLDFSGAAVGEVSVQIVEGKRENTRSSKIKPEQGRVWKGYGVNVDIIVAAAEAYVAALNKMLNARQERLKTETAARLETVSSAHSMDLFGGSLLGRMEV